MKQSINEIYWLRCIACLSVVVIHSISSGLALFDDGSFGYIEYLMYVGQMGLMFGTPTFIFISELLFAKNYSNGVPQGFLKKRVNALLIPYMSMGIIFAVFFNEDHTLESFIIQCIRNIFLGEFVAYFILIIFQFYILHMLLYKKLSKWSPKKVLPIALLINSLYLALFNFYPAPEGTVFEYIWVRGHWLLFLGWVFYFVLGFYCGKYYGELKQILHKHQVWVYILPIISLMAVVVLRYLGLPDVTSSKRIDVIFYTTSVIFLIIFVSSKINTVPSFVLLISKYSFNIYLIHKLIIENLGMISNSIIIHTISVFVISLASSIVIAYIFNKIPYGHYIIGNLGKIPRNLKQTKKSAA